MVNPLLDVQRYLPPSVYAGNYGRFDDQAHELFLLWWNRIVPCRSYVRGWKISPSHYLNQDLATIWLDR